MKQVATLFLYTYLRRNETTMMRTALHCTAVLLLVTLLLLLPQGASGGQKVSVTEGNLTLLVGTWQGHSRSVSPSDGQIRFESDVTLEVESTTEGTFTLENGATWQTAIGAKDGKVFLTYGRRVRAFTLEQEEDGRYQLSIRYDSTFRGFDRDNTLVLRKQ